MNVLVALYADLELYPPSLNAVNELAARVQQVHVVVRSLGHRCAQLPDNVSITTAVTRNGEEELRTLSGWEKAADFARYVRCLRRVWSESSPCMIVAFDPVPLMAVRLSRKLKSACLLWYHNHDKELRNSNRPFSVGWWAYETERRAFRRIDFFSVPARERLALFPVDKLRNPPAVLPNYPSWRRIGQQSPRRTENEIRLVYQGSLGRHHGFDEIVPWLGREVCGKRLSLTLIGKIDDDYRTELMMLAEHCGVAGWVTIKSFVHFTELPRVLSQFDIGLAIHKPVGVTYSTGGTASNKIYEYAAAGLPVVLYDSPHYREHLGEHEWAAFSSLTWADFSRAVERLMENLEWRSSGAMNDIRESLNYENCFEAAWSRLLHLLRRSRINEH